MVAKVTLGQMFFVSISSFLRQYHFTNALYSLILQTLTQYISVIK
jgi:hypothetical protein